MIYSHEPDQLPKFEPRIMKEETKTPGNWAMRTCELSHFGRVRLLVTLWTVDSQAPLCMGFSQQEPWSGWPHPLPGKLTDPGSGPCLYVSCIAKGALYHETHLGSPEVKWKSLSHVRLFVTPSEFFRPEYWSGELVPSPGDLPSPGTAPKSPSVQADSLLPDLP